MYQFQQHELFLVKELNHSNILVNAEANNKVRIIGFKVNTPSQAVLMMASYLQVEILFYRRFNL